MLTVSCGASSSTRVGVLTQIPDIAVHTRDVAPPPPPLPVVHSTAYNKAKLIRPASINNAVSFAAGVASQGRAAALGPLRVGPVGGSAILI